MTEIGTFLRYGPERRLSDEKMHLIGQCAAILEEYEHAGLTMTVRQLYYQMVARGLTGGENSPRLYHKIQAAINDGRMQGLLSWTAVEDRGRYLRGASHHPSVASALGRLRDSYRIDMWARQPFRPEVWIEKEALLGVISGVCTRERVDFYACKGYNSQSEAWSAGRRMASRVRRGQRPIVFHLGDHDPSGIDMTRDNRSKLELFSGVPVILQRLALNMPQIEELQPPPNPAKTTDSRSDEYIREFGELSWELDALEPRYIERLIERAVSQVRDEQIWEQDRQRELDDIEHLTLMIET